mmetsp:Transcript_66813/g.186483  ORF Transcript_66813/g.186483 Transcript_66813/m.186483 type:complete len:976 (+) Transcript_66813:62-2989(+)
MTVIADRKLYSEAPHRTTARRKGGGGGAQNALLERHDKWHWYETAADAWWAPTAVGAGSGSGAAHGRKQKDRGIASSRPKRAEWVRKAEEELQATRKPSVARAAETAAQQQQQQPQQQPQHQAQQESASSRRRKKRENKEASLRCSAGHGLKHFVTDLPSVCGACGLEVPGGTAMWGCRACDFDVCKSCRRNQPELAAFASSPTAAETPAAPQSRVMSRDALLRFRLDALEPEVHVTALMDVAVAAKDTQAVKESLPLCGAVGGSLDGSEAWVEADDLQSSESTTLSTQGIVLPEQSPPPPKKTMSASAEEWKPGEWCTSWGEMCWKNSEAFILEGCQEFNSGNVDYWSPECAEEWQFGLEEWALFHGEAVVAELAGDEKVMFPDGDMYEVFYPRDGIPEEEPEPAETPASRRSVGPTAGKCVVPGRVMAPRLTPSPTFANGGAAVRSSGIGCKNNADLRIGDIVSFMRNVQAARYPARCKLFEVVRAAAATALGPHFGRLALVGSTALRIDTPDSDVDAVAFTQAAGDGSPPPSAAEVLRRIFRALATSPASGAGVGAGPLRLHLVDCTRVPVLTVVAPMGDGDLLSLDLTVDQPLGEWHVLWFLSQRAEPEPEPAPLHQVPAPRPDGWEQGLEAAALRCVKWWLRRRRIPVSKEGGYPTVTWTLMVIHVLRCSLLYYEGSGGSGAGGLDESALLGAVAAFFDRFAEGGPAGTLLFKGGTHAQFKPQLTPAVQGQLSLPPAADLSVLDPTTTGLTWGIEPSDLAPKISAATRLLHAYELQRAAHLSAAALHCRNGNNPGDSPSASFQGGCNLLGGGANLRALFADVGEAANTLPAVTPSQEEEIAVMVLLDEELHLGILRQVLPKPGWSAPFLHRGDARSRLAMQPCDVDASSGAVAPHGNNGADLRWFCPGDFVCAARLRMSFRTHGCSQVTARGMAVAVLEGEDLERWCGMQALLHGAGGFEGNENLHGEAQ